MFLACSLPVDCTCFSIERAQLLGFLRILDALDVHHLRVDARGELVVLVEHVGDAARHARGEVAARGAEHHHASARHVFAAMVAHGLDDGVHARVAHREAFARHAAHEHFALGGAVQRHVADDHVLSDGNVAFGDGNTASLPPDSPLPK